MRRSKPLHAQVSLQVDTVTAEKSRFQMKTNCQQDGENTT